MTGLKLIIELIKDFCNSVFLSLNEFTEQIWGISIFSFIYCAIPIPNSLFWVEVILAIIKAVIAGGGAIYTAYLITKFKKVWNKKK